MKVYIVIKILKVGVRLGGVWYDEEMEEFYTVCATKEAAEKVVAENPHDALFIQEHEVQQ